jgi:predicted nucleic acid-binding protein
MPFCVDTSAWLDGWRRNYPPDVFKTLWASIETLVDEGVIIASDEVYVEIAKKDDDLHDWIQARKAMLVAPEEAIQERVAELLGKYPRLVDTLKGRSQADPFVIATAIERGAVVVTGELMGTAEKPRIPFVCQAEGVRCITFLEMIRELKLTF